MVSPTARREARLIFSTNGLGQLWLEDELLLQKQTSGGSTVKVAFNIDHPNGTWDFNNNAFINTNWNDHFVTNTYQRTNASYAITYAFEPDQEWLRARQQKLDRYRQQGLADTSREVTTETLNVMGLSWMLQTERIPRVLAAQQEMLLHHAHRLGRMAQEFGKGYYIDVYQQLSAPHPASGFTSKDYAREDKIFEVENYFGSAAEHALIEQLQSSNLLAASAVKMLQIGNTNGQRIYQAKSSNWSTVQGNLSNYDNNWLKTNYIDRGYVLLLPANGSNHVAGASTWAGYGLVARGIINGGTNMVMLINGAYHGGYVSDPTVVVNAPFVAQSGYTQPTYFNPVNALVPTPTGADPVNMADGSFHIQATDLSLGQAEPRGINLTRSYSSSRRNHNLAAMAHGWMHNYYVRANDISAPLAGLGDTTPAQMAPMIVATRSALELYNTAGSAKNWAVTTLIAKWGLDQLINNAVSVSLGEDTLQFIKQPDGTFSSPAKSTMTLLKTNSVYWLQERHGNTFKFNSSGLLANIVDQYSQPLTVTYDSSNRVWTIQDWKNRTFTFTYSGTPQRLTSVSDSTGRSISYGYDTTYSSQGDLASFSDAEAKASTFLYDTNHQIIATKDPLNRVVVSNAYDSFGRVIEQYSKGDTNQTWRLYWSGLVNTEIDPAGGRTQYRYDEKRRLVRTIDAAGHNSYLYYDGQDHVTTTLSELFAQTDYFFDGRHNLTAINDPLSAEDDFYYDAQDNLWHRWDKRGNHSYFGYNSKFQLTGSTNGAGDWTTFAYNSADGTLSGRTDTGGTTSYGYDSYGQLSSSTFPGSLGSESYQNNVRGDVTNRINARGFATALQYNNRRELTDAIAPTNLVLRTTYDDAANVAATTDPRGFTSSNLWSVTHKRLAMILPATPQGVPISTNIYDSRDWLSRTLNPLQQAIVYTNDAAQRLISTTDPLLRSTRIGYDGDDRKIWTTNAANEGAVQDWNPRSELINVIDPAGHTVKRFYDGAGNQVLLTNRNQKRWQFQFDGANRLTNTVTPLNRETRLTFDSRGLLRTGREPSGQMTTNSYDARARLTNRADQVASTTYAYDANNNRQSVSESSKSNSWIYDAYDRVSSYTDSENNSIQYRTDANGNVTNIVYPGGKNVFYAFDSLSRLTNVTDWANRKTGIEYDLASRVKKITRPNATTREISYDAAGEMTNIWEKTGPGVPICLFKFKWNDAARMDWEFAAPLPHGYTPPSRTMTYDEDNRISTFNGSSVSYDLDGNLTSGPLTNNTFVTYAYDARNRLLSAGGLSYGYDPAGNRTAITNGATLTKFVVNPNAALSQVLMRITNGVTNYYIYGLGLLYEADDAGNTRTYHYDFRGSTVAITDGNGNVTDRAEYSSYGLPTYRLGTTDTPFLYNGRYGVMTDPNGLLHMRARYFNPYLCRFLNPDPVGFSGGLNFYAYADGNPISSLDPFGLGAQEPDGRSWIPTRGYMDPFGNTHPTFCFSCHGNTPEAQFYKYQADMANRQSWTIFAYTEALTLGLTFGGGMLAEGITETGQALRLANAAEAIGEGPGGMTRLRYQPNPKHGAVQRGGASPAPQAGQGALDGSIGFSENSTGRISLDADGVPVVFRQHEDGVFHGYRVQFNELTAAQKNALLENGFINRKGEPLP